MRPGITDALSRAFFREWARVGYAALSLERVASEAGVGKSALYRRWPSKVAVVADLLPPAALPLADVADTGSLDGDVKAVLFAFRRLLRHAIVRRVLADFSVEAARNPDLVQVVRPLQQARRERVRQVIERAVARGEVAETVDREMALDLLAGPIYWRLAITGGRLGSDEALRLAAVISAAIRATDARG